MDFWTDFDSNIMPKRKKSIKTGDNSKVARKGNGAIPPSQPSQLDGSWSSADFTLDEGSNSGDIDKTCKVCNGEIIHNFLTSSDIRHLKCCICFCYYHGECLSIDENLLPHLCLLEGIGGWCCAPCIRGVKVSNNKSLKPIGCNSSQSMDSARNTGVCSGDQMMDICQKLSSERSDLKVQIQTITEFLSPNLGAGVDVTINSNLQSSAPKPKKNWNRMVVNNMPKIDLSNDDSKVQSKPVIKSVLKAVHVDLIDKQRRAKNVIFSGLRPSASVPDAELFQTLCFDYLGLHLDVPFCRRMGKVMDGRVQPLLVAFHDEEAAQSVLKVAKQLRNSADAYTSSNVYINRDLTKAESAAEYESRQSKRKRRLAKNQQKATNMDTQSSTSGVGPSDASPHNSDVIAVGKPLHPANPGAMGSK